MAELNNDKLSNVAGGVGEQANGFKIGDWVYPKKERISPRGMMTYFKIEDIIDADSSVPRYVLGEYAQDDVDGRVYKVGEKGRYLADELAYGRAPVV